jgi:hypothetical protein
MAYPVSIRFITVETDVLPVFLKKVKMVRDQRPCQTLSPGLPNNHTKSINEELPINIIIEYFFAPNSSGDNMVQCARSVYSGLAWHCCL